MTIDKYDPSLFSVHLFILKVVNLVWLAYRVFMFIFRLCGVEVNSIILLFFFMNNTRGGGGDFEIVKDSRKGLKGCYFSKACKMRNRKILINVLMREVF